MSLTRIAPVVLLVASLATPNALGATPFPRENADCRLQLVADEADAALAIFEKRRAGALPEESDWVRLYATEGYRRLKQREASMKRAFEDSEFKAFVLSDELLGKGPSLAEALARWKSGGTAAACGLALAYLPKGATIRAKVYPVIKPKQNSFVFEPRGDAAIFLWLNPEWSSAQFENTVAHEVHHVGFTSACPTSRTKAELEGLSSGQHAALEWLGAFGEGVAMLAAAGGTSRHPHESSPPADRSRWDRDVARAADDQRAVEAFLVDVAGGLPREVHRERGFGFYGVQRPWCTVGWRMAAQIETSLGRERLVSALCDTRLLLPASNEAGAALERTGRDRLLPPWSGRLLGLLAGADEHVSAGRR